MDYLFLNNEKIKNLNCFPVDARKVFQNLLRNEKTHQKDFICIKFSWRGGVVGNSRSIWLSGNFWSKKYSRQVYQNWYILIVFLICFSRCGAILKWGIWEMGGSILFVRKESQSNFSNELSLIHPTVLSGS